jgi:hypothetical protein
MACTALSKGRGLDCSRISGGVKFVYFSVYDNFDRDDWSYTSGSGKLEIDTIDFQTSVIYRYAVPRGSTTANETLTGSTENGSLFFTPNVSLVLNKLTKEDQNEIKLLGQTQVRIFVQLNATLTNGHDVIIAMGMHNGMTMNAGTADTGAGFGDRNGYSLTFDGLESQPFAMLEDYTSTPFDNSGFTGETIDPS